MTSHKRTWPDAFGVRRAPKETEILLHGFDLTQFHAQGFQLVLRALGIDPEQFERDQDEQKYRWRNDPDQDRRWKDASITIVTSHNPVGGGECMNVHFDENFKPSTVIRKRQPNDHAWDPDFVGYMGLQANDKRLMQLAVLLIQHHASHIKAEEEGASTYIGV